MEMKLPWLCRSATMAKATDSIMEGWKVIEDSSLRSSKMA